MIKVNDNSDACPIPVVKTKKLSANYRVEGQLRHLLIMKLPYRTLQRWLTKKDTMYILKKLLINEFKVTMTVNAEAAQIAANSAVAPIEEEKCPITPLNKKNIVVVIRSNQMGNGEEELGKLY